jgi:hypothetical protein
VPPSSDLAISAGRGANIPRAGLGRDTLLGLAQSQRRTLAYTINTAVPAGAAGAYAEATTITLNNLFSPNGAGSAVGFAKYMAFYSKAWVIGARALLRGVVASSSTATAVALVITTNNTSLGSMVAAIDNGMCDWMVSLTNPDRVTLNQSVDIARFLNKPKVLDDPQLFCTSAAGPSQLVVAHVGIQDVGAFATATTLDYVIELTFDVVFTDPIPFT